MIARKANIVSYPQIKRAEFFKKNASLKKMPLIVKNGPRFYWSEKSSSLEFHYLKDKYEKILIYQGGLNWQRGIKNIIDIFSNIKGAVGLILIGKTDNDVNFEKELEEYLQHLNIEQRVEVLPVMNYSKLAGLTRICDMGFGVMIDEEENRSYNIKYLAGASNKLVEYMACGLVSIVPNSPEYVDYISSKGIGVVVDPNDPIKSSKIISEVLFDEKKLNRMKRLALKNFKDNENFDIQFKKILKSINQ